MITIHQHPIEDSRTPGEACKWLATATVDGAPYEARSRYGAPHELARQLVAAGIEDQPVQVITGGLAGQMTYRSLHKMAGRTLEENRTTPLREAGWVDPAVRAAQFTGAFRDLSPNPELAATSAPKTGEHHQIEVSPDA
jgi:hypothetical protein